MKEAELRADRSRGTEMKGNNGTATSHRDVVDSDNTHYLHAIGMGGAGLPVADEDKTLQQLYHDPSMKSRQPKQVRTKKYC